MKKSGWRRTKGLGRPSGGGVRWSASARRHWLACGYHTSAAATAAASGRPSVARNPTTLKRIVVEVVAPSPISNEGRREYLRTWSLAGSKPSSLKIGRAHV